MDFSKSRANYLSAPANICIVYGCNRHIATVVVTLLSSSKKKINADS